MVPALYVPLAQVPQTSSGKVDRLSIRKIIQNIPEDQAKQYALTITSHVAPSTDIEKELQLIWASILHKNVDTIGVHDNFFRSGGDSVTAMRMVAMARNNDINLTVTDVFQHPVLGDMAGLQTLLQSSTAAAISDYEPFSLLSVAKPDELSTSSVQPPLPWSREEIVDILPTTDFQSLSVLGSLHQSRNLLAYWTFDADGICDIPRWRRSLFKLIRRHEILRTAYGFYPARATAGHSSKL